MTHQQLISSDPQQALSAIEAAQCVISFDLQGHITAVNQAYLDLCGYRRDELIGQPVQMLTDPRDPNRLDVGELVAAMARGETRCSEYRRLAKDGRPFWVSSTYVPIRDESGQVTTIVTYAVDVTASRLKKCAAEMRVQAMQRSQAAIEFTPTGEIVWANDIFLSTMGYTLDEIRGRHHSMFCEPGYASSPEYQRFWEDLGAGGFRQVEVKRVAKGGRIVWISGSYCALVDETGRTAGVVKYASDITAYRNTVAALVAGLEALSDGDLTNRITSSVSGEMTSVRDSFNATTAALEAMVNEIRQRAEHMNLEAGQIAAAASDLARRGESQAAALEETAAAVEEISGNITMTSQSARDADNAARDALNVVLKGAEVVSHAISAIERIDDHTKQMGEFTRVIEGFAFQTNLLSINAAVEAARAGEVGRGFAVVANEVRNLAQQSAKASQNIADLIGKSETEVKAGVKLVRDAGVSLEQIQTAVRGVVENITGIAHATTEQSAGVREVSESLSQLDGVNQANLAMAEEYAAAAGALSGQVEELGAMMGHFRTESDRTAAPARSTARAA